LAKNNFVIICNQLEKQRRARPRNAPCFFYFLGFHLELLLTEECVDLRRTSQDAEPRIFIERRRPAIWAMQRNRAFSLTFRLRRPFSRLSRVFPARRRSSTAAPKLIRCTVSHSTYLSRTISGCQMRVTTSSSQTRQMYSER
jgi:hypothetical protein